MNMPYWQADVYGANRLGQPCSEYEDVHVRQYLAKSIGFMCWYLYGVKKTSICESLKDHCISGITDASDHTMHRVMKDVVLSDSRSQQRACSGCLRILRIS